MKKLALVGVRGLFTGFYLVSAISCLLAYLPFTYHQMHNGGLVGWFDEFARLHQWLNLAMLLPALFLINEAWRQGIGARWIASAFGICQIGLSYTLVAHPVLANLENNFNSFVWSLAMLVPVAWVAVLDLASYAGLVEWTEKAGGGASHLAACCGGLFVSGLYAIVSFARQVTGAPWQEAAVAAGWSVLAHLLVFLGAFLLLEFFTGLAGFFRRPARVEFWLCHLALAAAVCFGTRAVVWPSVGFEGPLALTYSIALGVLLASVNAGIAVWLAAGQTVSDGIAAATAPATLGLVRSWRSGVAAAGLLAAAGIGVALQSAAFDWNYLLQKVTAAGIWLASFACFYAMLARQARTRNLAWLLAPVALLAAYKGLEAQPESHAAVERWAGYDASFRLARQFLAPVREGQESFYQFLTRHTNLPADLLVRPASVDLTPALAHSQAPLPHIFIFTIDSLRRDYLEPYNPAVFFTPAIAAFARESTVFRNAFTRYGGTGLSEPAIWSGSLLLHKQYVLPFAPMNALEKLINADQYQPFLSRDSILDTILPKSDPAVVLDPPEATMNLDFARTLETLKKQIDARGPSAPPIFAYTQPQNLHVSVIHREGNSADGSYPGFNPPYATRVKHIDEAFGSFIEFLKTHGLYEHSIIVLTADHGDSLGEDGRWGHAYTLFPEIVRIPLMIHIPDDLRAQTAADADSLAFSTDITPTLYYLLGHRPVQKNSLFGSPLFTATPVERQREPEAGYLLASSYAAVYGMLSANGRQLYIADGVNYQNYRFDLNGPTAESRDPGSQFQAEQEKLIREQILAISRFYHLEEGAGSGL